MSIANDRQEARDTFAALVTNRVTAAQAVYNYLAADFKGQSPVIVVASGGTHRVPMTLRGTRPRHFLNVYSFVAYADQGSEWTEQDSEDKLDELEAQLAALVDDCQKTAAWSSLAQVEESRAEVVVIGGVEYRRELKRLVAE